MSRVTDKRLNDKLLLLTNRFPNLRFSYSNGRQAVCQRIDSGGVKTLSGYLTNAEMWEWLDGSLTCLSLLREDV